jgi:ribonuclease T2
MANKPDAYFRAARLLFNAIEFPDMARLSREPERGTPLTAQVLAERFADLNEGLPAHAITVKANRKGWLQEIGICLGRDFKPRQCPAHTRRTPATMAIKIWRGRY